MKGLHFRHDFGLFLVIFFWSHLWVSNAVKYETGSFFRTEISQHIATDMAFRLVLMRDYCIRTDCRQSCGSNKGTREGRQREDGLVELKWTTTYIAALEWLPRKDLSQTSSWPDGVFYGKERRAIIEMPFFPFLLQTNSLFWSII